MADKQSLLGRCERAGTDGIRRLKRKGMLDMCAMVTSKEGLRPRPTGARRGTITPLICLGLMALLGLTALTFDVGRLTTAKSSTQNACDAAALAGAGKLPPAGQVAMDQAALLYLANCTGGTTQPVGTGTNPRTYTINGDTVRITNPYSDAFTTAKLWSPNDLLEVRVARTVQMPFGAAAGVPSASVVSRAVAWRYANSGGAWNAAQGVLFAKDLGFALNCNKFTVKGSLGSNSDIAMSLNNVWIGNTVHAKNSVSISGNNLNGHFNLEYGTTYDIRSIHKDIAQYTRMTPPVDLVPPINFDPAAYNTDFHIATYYNSSLTITESFIKWPPGTYYVQGDLNLQANNVDLSDCTFIVGGSVNVNTNNLTLSPHEKYMCFYLLGGGTINLNDNNVSVYGDLYAPNGYINSISNNTHYGQWVARRISVTCNTFELDGIPDRINGQSELKLVE